MLFTLAAAHVCHVPSAAYQLSGMTPYEFMLSAADQRALASYTKCVCGPEGAEGARESRDAQGRYFYDPVCKARRSK